MRLIDADEIGLTDFEIVMCNGDYKEALKMGTAAGSASAFSEDLATGEKIMDLYSQL